MMSKLSKLLVVVVALAGLVLVGFVLSRRDSKAPETGMPPSLSEPSPPPQGKTDHSTFFTKRVHRGPAQTAAQGQPTGAPDVATNAIAGWEEKVDAILGSTNSDPEKAKQMIEMFPTLTADGQEEVARHLSNLLPDQDYGLMRPYLTNAALPEDVLDALLDDVLNRPNSLKLPALLDVARNPQNPKAAEAKDFLELLLEEDYGDDWGKWQAKMEAWLKDNPD
jgi:hypothetical protein